ncbi:MAG: hypothetical protein R3F61_26620 [Myxococcota bacterium]
MRSWTRTLNLDDAHTLLALAEPGLSETAWCRSCHASIPHLSAPRRRELIRMVREDFLSWEDGRVELGLFSRYYVGAPASVQVELVNVQWALTHPLPVVAVAELVEPALASADPEIPLDRVTALVAQRLTTGSQASLGKSRTVLVGALEGVGALRASGTGKHRRLFASRGVPHELTRAYLVARGGPSLPAALTACLEPAPPPA